MLLSSLSSSRLLSEVASVASAALRSLAAERVEIFLLAPPPVSVLGSLPAVSVGGASIVTGTCFSVLEFPFSS